MCSPINVGWLRHRLGVVGTRTRCRGGFQSWVWKIMWCAVTTRHCVCDEPGSTRPWSYHQVDNWNVCASQAPVSINVKSGQSVGQLPGKASQSQPVITENRTTGSGFGFQICSGYIKAERNSVTIEVLLGSLDHPSTSEPAPAFWDALSCAVVWTSTENSEHLRHTRHDEGGEQATMIFHRKCSTINSQRNLEGRKEGRKIGNIKKGPLEEERLERKHGPHA